VDGRGGRRAGAPLSPTRQEVRAAAKRRRALRGAAVSAVSTVVVLGTLVTVIVTSSGWPKVRASFFDWGDFRKAFPDVLDGFWLDVRLFVILEIVVLALGLLIAVMRTTRAPALYPLRLLSAVFTDVMRGTPTFLLVYLFGFGIPTLELSGVPTDVTILGGAALALSYSAYVAEVYRAGIESVHPSQFSGALALGLTRPQALRHVILPQAVRRVIPPLLNDFISLQKDVALVAVLGVVEAVRVAQIAASSQFIYTPLMAAGLLYLCVTIPMVRITDHVQARARRARGQVVV
jgi:polar amino acid transport system permease protein